MSALSSITDAVILGLLWMVCSVPVFTIGAASSAFYYAYHKAVRQKEGYAWKEFFHGLRSNFKQSTILWLIFLGLYIVNMASGIVLAVMQEIIPFADFFMGVIIVVVVIMTIWCLYAFPYLARFENKNKDILKNSALIAFANLPCSILLLLLFAATALMLFVLPVTGIVLPAVYVWLANKILERVFRKYMTEEDVEEEKRRDKDI